DAVDIRQNVIVPESKHRKTVAFQTRRSNCVARNLLRVLTAIHLDDELRFEAAEIHRVGGKRYLSAKLCPNQMAIAQLQPEQPLGVGRVRSQVPGLAQDPVSQMRTRESPSPLVGEGCAGLVSDSELSRSW